MFSKVLIAEDADYISSAVKEVLRELCIEEIQYAKYCDEAFLKLKKAQNDNNPYELLITDLSFIENPNPQKLISGEDLIEKARVLQPKLKIVVFSIEDKPYRVKKICNELQVNAFVWKSIYGQSDLKKAILKVSEGDFFISDKVASALKDNQSTEITDFDIFILTELANGLSQEKISKKLKEHNFDTSSISSVEKRLKFLKEEFNAKNPTNLISISKDLGVI